MLDRSLIRTFIDGALSAQIRSFDASGPLHSIDRPFKTRTHQIELRQPPCNHKILCGLYIPRADALSTCFYFALEINFRWSESKCKVTVSTRRIRVTFCPVVPVRRTQVTVRRFLRSFLLIAGARRYSYSPWSFTGIFTRSGKSSA